MGLYALLLITDYLEPFLLDAAAFPAFPHNETAISARHRVPHNRLSLVGHLELVEDVGDVILHCLEAEGEAFGDNRVTFALWDEMKDFPFTLSEVGEGNGRSSSRQCREIADHALRNGEAEDGLRLCFLYNRGYCCRDYPR